MKMKLILFVLFAFAFSFAQEKKQVVLKDTIVWVQKTEILQYIEAKQKELDVAKAQFEGQLTLLRMMPDSVQVIQKKKQE